MLRALSKEQAGPPATRQHLEEGGEGNGGPESWFDQAAGAGPREMLGKADMGPEEGRKWGPGGQDFSTEDVLPSGWVQQLEAGHQRPWKQRWAVACLGWRSGRKQRRAGAQAARAAPELPLICHNTAG